MLLTITTTANAQFKFGVKGGVGLTTMSFDKDVFNADNRAAFFVGPSVRMGFGLLGFDLAAMYEQRSAKLENGWSSAIESITGTEVLTNTVTQKSIIVPLNARLNLGPVYLAAGPQLAFNLGDDIQLGESQWYKETFRPKDSSFSVNLGAGLMIGHVEVGVSYNIACGNTGDITVESVKEEVTNDLKDFNSKSNVWKLSAAYYF